MKAFRTDLEYACTSAGFLLAVIGTMVALLAGVFTSFFVDQEVISATGLNYGYHWDILQRGLKSEAFTFAVPILSALSCGGVYLEEQKSGYYKFALPRYGRKRYVWVKVLVNLLSGGLSIWLGVLLTAVLEWAYFAPMEVSEDTARLTGMIASVRYAYAEGALWLKNGSVYGVQAEQALACNMLIPVLQWAAIAFLAGAFWAGVSQLFGLLSDNRYMAYTASFLFSYFAILLFTRFFDFIYIFNPRQWFSPLKYWEGRNLGVMGILCECVILCAIVNMVLMNRKLEPV